MGMSSLLPSSLIAVLLFAGCSTSGKQTQQREQKKPRVATKPVATPHPQPRPTISPTDELAQWTIKMGNPETSFTIQDRQKVAAMAPAPKPGSLSEAALVVGILRDIMTPPGGSQKFKEVDLNATAAQPTTDDKNVLPKPMRVIDNANVIEIRAREKGLDLSNALANNLILKNLTVFAWAWEAIALDGNSDIFRQNVTTIIKSEAMLWQELARKSGALAVTVVPVPSVAPQASPEVAGNQGAPLSSPVALPSVAPAAPGAALDSEKQMALAQEAASKENFAKAVEEATKIPSSAPNYTVAQENVKTWSNRAVTDLRKKAAYEYRSASSVTDIGIKRSYLTKAKNYLEDAAQKFPAASNQDTVKENLGMITKELERLN